MTRNLGVKLAKAVAGDIDGLERIKRDIGYFLPDVLSEIDTLVAMEHTNPLFHRERALLFALASPQNRFDNNVLAARRLHDGLSTFATLGDVYQALTADKTGTVTSGSVARAIHNSLPLLRNLDTVFNGANIRDWATTRQLFGAGPKVSAFAAHLIDPTDSVFTIDTHMTRGIVDTVLGIFDTWTMGNSAYLILEDALIAWAEREYPNVPIFAVQWAMWSVFRGSFDSHTAIFT